MKILAAVVWLWVGITNFFTDGLSTDGFYNAGLSTDGSSGSRFLVIYKGEINTECNVRTAKSDVFGNGSENDYRFFGWTNLVE